MNAPRRAAQDDDFTIVSEPSVPARRATAAIRRPGKIVRMVVAPLAVLSVMGLAAGLMVVPVEAPLAQQAEPRSQATAPMGNSRSLPRPALTLPASPSQSPAALPTASATTPSTSASPTPTPSAPVASPTPAPATSAASVTPSPEPAPETTTPAPPSETPPPAPDYTTVGAEVGVRYTTAGINVRTGPGTGYDVASTLGDGAAVTITDRQSDGWRQVTGSASGWVSETYLTETKPAPAPAPAPSTGSSVAAKAESTSGRCAKAGDLESNLTARTATVLRALCATFPHVSSYGGYRPDSDSYHGSGRAIDVMVTGDYGWEIARWARDNAGMGIIEVIYQQKIWTAQRSGDGWRSMSDRGSTSANHYDHVHISVR